MIPGLTLSYETFGDHNWETYAVDKKQSNLHYRSPLWTCLNLSSTATALQRLLSSVTKAAYVADVI